MFAHGQIMVQILLVDPTKGAQKITCRGPQAFDGVGMDLTDTITIIVARPFFLAMTHRVVSALDFVVALPFIGVTPGVSLGVPMHVLLQRLAIGMGPHPQTTLPTVTSHSPDNGRPIVVVRPVPALLVGAAARWIKRIGVFLPFFPPRSETSHPFPCRDPARSWRSTSYSRWLGVACASARRTDARARVPQLKRWLVRPCSRHALTTRCGGVPNYSPQRGSQYRGYTSAGSCSSDNQQSRACAGETRVRVPGLLHSLDSAGLWGESIAPPTPDFHLRQVTRLWGKSLFTLTIECTN